MRWDGAHAGRSHPAGGQLENVYYSSERKQGRHRSFLPMKMKHLWTLGLGKVTAGERTRTGKKLSVPNLQKCSGGSVAAQKEERGEGASGRRAGRAVPPCSCCCAKASRPGAGLQVGCAEI